MSKQKPIKPMPCPRCKRRGTLQKLVDVVVTAPAGCYALNKKGIRSPRVKVKAVIWDQEAWFCTHPKCGWNNHGPGHMTIKEEDCLFRPLHVVHQLVEACTQGVTRIRLISGNSTPEGPTEKPARV